VQSHVQNAVAVLAVALAIAMLGLTLVVPHRSLVVSDQAFYADARARPQRQSPKTACTMARAATAAVSARRMRGPSDRRTTHG
jgi:hypothetical protein